ncbi:LptF/LptG family permease [Rhodobacteraceae bacterium 2CG4]|uniref:LptF/LptG family permease n=1 Tax=Halovulum marinum TaxID=2662447 RepID=A0A6L5YZX8_9RHOB|nr:LptF/LptG family permease [Halovulum marinum]MSU89876.1 LptF/LptG family permease [Halovulum marinum]
MLQLDRYILRQIAMAFVFFTFILAGVIWLSQAVRLIDLVLSSGQSLIRLFEFSLLVLPRVLSMVVPLAGFAAVLYVVNKLYSEAELVVMMMSGQGPYALARPVAAFAALVGLTTLLMTNILAPWGELKLDRDRQALTTELANALIREGRFLHPVDGLTIFIRRAGDNGRMEGVFLHDERDPERPVTYTAEQALLLRDGDVARLIMSRGAALSYSPENRLLGRVQFDDFTYDLSDLIADVPETPQRAGALWTWQLIAPDAEVRALRRFNRGYFLAAGHERIVFGVHAFLLPILGLAVMLTGGYRRRGFGKRILAAVAAGVALIVAGMGAKSMVIGAPAAWPVSYAPAAAATLLSLVLFRSASRPRRLATAAAATTA